MKKDKRLVYKDMIRAANRMAELHARRERAEQRRIHLTEVSEQTGIDRRTLAKWYTNTIEVFHSAAIAALCAYYGCAVDELITLENGTKGESASSGVLVIQAV